jgi:Spy/CpxP family protein refolding chaperone
MLTMHSFHQRFAAHADAHAARVAGCGPAFGRHGDAGGFGVRRPLRFLADRLELDESQVVELSAILDDLKIERAQGAVDDRRALSAWAEAFTAEAFDTARVAKVAEERAASAERLQAAIARALGRMHALLRPEQRTRLSYLVRTGALLL